MVVDDDVEVESTEELSRHPIQAVAQTAPVRPRLPAHRAGARSPDRARSRAARVAHRSLLRRAAHAREPAARPVPGDRRLRAGAVPAPGGGGRVDQRDARVGRARRHRVGRAISTGLVRVYKQYRFYTDLPEIDVEVVVSNRYHEPVRATFGLEVNLNLDSVRTGPSASSSCRDASASSSTPWARSRTRRRSPSCSPTAVYSSRSRSQPAARIFYYPIETPLRTWRGYAQRLPGNVRAADVEARALGPGEADLRSAPQGRPQPRFPVNDATSTLPGWLPSVRASNVVRAAVVRRVLVDRRRRHEHHRARERVRRRVRLLVGLEVAGVRAIVVEVVVRRAARGAGRASRLARASCPRATRTRGARRRATMPLPV